MKLRSVACLIVFVAAGLSACNYSKSYFRVDANGKKIKADGPLDPNAIGDGLGTAGTEGGGTGTAGTTSGGTDGATTGDILPGTGGSGTGATAGTTGGATAGTATSGSTDTKQPAYAIAFQSKDRTSKKTSIGWGVVATNSFLETPKLLVTGPDDKTTFAVPAISSDGRKILYTSSKSGSAPALDYRVLSNLAQTPATDALWKQNSGGASIAWVPSGEVIYAAGGCGLMKRANGDASVEKDEAPAPTASHSGSLYGQITVSPVHDASNPASGWVLFTLVNLDAAKTAIGSSDIFAKKLGDADASHFVALTTTTEEAEQDPVVSPDGKYLAYAVNMTVLQNPADPASPKIKIHRVKLCDLAYASGSIQCGNARFLYPMEDLDHSSPCWSWDGQKIFFASDDTANGNMDIFVASFGGGAVSGKAPVNLTGTDGADETQLTCAAAVDYPVEPSPGL